MFVGELSRVGCGEDGTPKRGKIAGFVIGKRAGTRLRSMYTA